MSTAPIPTYADPNLVPSLLDEAPERKFSVVTFQSGWPEDLERLVASLEKHCSAEDYELVAVSNASPEVDHTIGRLAASEPRLRGISFSQHVGFGGGANGGVLQSRGEIVVLADTSVEAGGDFLPPIAAALEDPSAGLVGKWGLITADLRHFHEETEGEVDAMQAYCMAFRRADVRGVGFFDPKFKFYRHADIDFSLRWRDKGFRILALDLPLERHAHREWEALTPDQRDTKSRDNHARLMRTWRDRTDLLTRRLEPHQH